MKTDLERYQDELREQGITWVRGGDDGIIQIIVNGRIRFFYSDGSAVEGQGITAQQREEFKQLTMPLIEWLNKNFHPHTKVIVDQTSAELSEGSIAHYTEDFLKG
jgi:hypothetical protein